MAKKVKDGDIVTIEEKKYRIGETSAIAINIWLEFSEQELKISDSQIHLYRADSRSGDFDSRLENQGGTLDV